MLVELTVADEPIPGVRIDEISGRSMTLSPPSTVQLDVGHPVSLRWGANERGRYVVTGQVAEMLGSQVVVELQTEPRIEQLRRFVRGGGGEEIQIHRGGAGDACDGWICDLSERSVRARFAAVSIGDGDALWLTIYLDEDTIEVRGTATRVTVRPPEAPGPDASRVEVIAMLDTDETQAQTIRRYVFRQQLLARARNAN
jgi:hypothetical protein